MYKDQKISVVIPAYNEEEGIFRFIKSVEDLNFIDEIIAVDNNSSDNTKTEILKTSATYIFEEIPGYGSALKRGMREAGGNIIITTEPDGTFSAHDFEKLLAYSNQFPVVLGTRTSSNLIWSGAYMPNWVRFGNLFCAKTMEFLFNGPNLTDVGCTMKAIKRAEYETVASKLKVNGSSFSPHFMMICLNEKFRIIEIPVQYLPRIGKSKITGGNVPRTIWLGLCMISAIVYFGVTRHIHFMNVKCPRIAK
jgi:glycosyltransferase involved in cell wall biosynthesis